MSKAFIGASVLLLVMHSGGESRTNGVDLAPGFDGCVAFTSLTNSVRDGRIARREALKQVQVLLPQLEAHFYSNGGRQSGTSGWVFPIRGYDSRSIGGVNGSGYDASGYDYFDGNRHGGHPAHDLFVHDLNQDSIDDITRKPVNVLSMSPGIVVATEPVWETESALRGGRYVWIYDPFSRSLFYYAHNGTVLVQPCDIVRPGDVIAHVGRTGLNAFKKRSPTHLHVMQLLLDSNNYPRPVDSYRTLTAIGSVH